MVGFILTFLIVLITLHISANIIYSAGVNQGIEKTRVIYYTMVKAVSDHQIKGTDISSLELDGLADQMCDFLDRQEIKTKSWQEIKDMTTAENFFDLLKKVAK